MVSKHVITGVVIVALLLTTCYPAEACCWIRGLIPAQQESCPSCGDDGNGCTGGVYSVPAYYGCVAAGSGESGRRTCRSQSQWIGTWYPCEENIDWGGYITCILAVAGCAVTCAACILEPTKLSCIGCAVTCGAAGAGCYFSNYCDCEKGTGQSVTRSIFVALEDANCTG